MLPWVCLGIVVSMPKVCLTNYALFVNHFL
nr:MAG TPA: hypothetical protein [Caudoviricetes sp.]